MKFTRFLDWIIIIIGLLSTSLITLYVSQKNLQEDRIRFDYETNFILRRVQNRMQSYEGTLIELRAFLRNSPDTSRETVKRYIDDTEIFGRFPGLQGLGFSEIIPKANLAQHISKMRKSIPEYDVFPKGDREIYTSIILIEPENRRNRKAIGYDMYSEKVRRWAMDEAAEGNTTAMTEAIVLIQEDAPHALLGFNIYLPHYKKGIDLSLLENRRKNLIGYVYAPFRAGELFKAIFSEMTTNLDVEIYEGAIDPKKLFYNYEEKNINSDLEKVSEIYISGRRLLVRTSPLETFERASSTLKTAGVFVLGILLTILVYSIYLFTRLQMQTARLMAGEKEKLLQKEKEHVIARDDFLSIASHELKTPLTSLKLQAQVMLRAINRNDPSAFSPEKVNNLVKQIDTQTTRLTRLVDDMLDISRIRTGRLKIEKTNVDLNETILDVIERLKPQFIRGIGEAPSTEFSGTIKGNWDKFRLEQVLTNLFTNAIRYGNSKPVKVKTEIAGNIARICVIDQGIGIAKENSERIFERFERAGMSANEVSGLGLGLFITNQIIKAHGGTIRVESEQGVGSTFIVELPLTVS